MLKFIQDIRAFLRWRKRKVIQVWTINAAHHCGAESYGGGPLSWSWRGFGTANRMVRIEVYYVN